MTAACPSNVSTQGVRLHLAFELGWTQWKLAFTVGHGQQPRQRTIRARDLAALEQEIAKAKRRFQLADAAAVVSCYEAGRDGFWLHRYLTAHGIANVIVDSASIEVNRRKRRVKRRESVRNLFPGAGRRHERDSLRHEVTVFARACLPASYRKRAPEQRPLGKLGGGSPSAGWQLGGDASG